MIGSTYDTGEILTDVREYNEGFPVKLVMRADGRLAISAVNENGHNGVEIDLSDLLAEVERQALLVIP